MSGTRLGDVRIGSRLSGEILLGRRSVIDGDSPGLRDIYLFAAVQLHSSMPVPPIEVLKNAEALDALRAWVFAMQERCAGYRHLYSAQHFPTSSAAPERSTPVQRLTFWVGAVVHITLAPFVVPLVLYKRASMQRRRLMVQSARF